MPAILLTLFIVYLWTVQGLGFVRWLLPGLRPDRLLGWVLSAWLGLVVSLAILINLYYLVPGVTVNGLAWPVTLVLCAASIVLYLRRRPVKTVGIGSHGWVILAFTLAATVAVLRPLIGQSQLAFYFSNNGEFSNYAAMADVVQFHPASTHIPGGYAPRSREGVAGVLCAAICAMTGHAALWVIQPLAGAVAALAFASLGLLFRYCALRCHASQRVGAVLALLYGWAILSAAVQQFWIMSFVSQYISIALWFGGLLFLGETRSGQALSRWARTGVFGLLLGVLLCVYPEMFLPNAALLAAFELAAAEPPVARGPGQRWPWSWPAHWRRWSPIAWVSIFWCSAPEWDRQGGTSTARIAPFWASSPISWA